MIIIERKNINKLIVNVNNADHGFVVFSENFYPGWTAKVNGVKQTIIKVNGFLKAVFVEHGENFIELEYKPVVLYVGFFISFCAIVFLLIFMFFRRKYEIL